MIRARELFYVDPRLARAVTVPPPWPRRALYTGPGDRGQVVYADPRGTRTR